MKQAKFLQLLQKVSLLTHQWTQTVVIETLPFKFCYEVILNTSFDDSMCPLFTVYPEDDNKKFTQLEEQEVLQLLWRQGKIPVWIDINIIKVTDKITTLQLLCAGRYTANDKKLYYHQRRQGPFGIKSPDLPTNYQKGVKFKLHQ